MAPHHELSEAVFNWVQGPENGQSKHDYTPYRLIMASNGHEQWAVIQRKEDGCWIDELSTDPSETVQWSV